MTDTLRPRPSAQEPDLAQALLRERLHYDPETGLFVWRKRVARCVAVGGSAGGRHRGTGYWCIKVFGRTYAAHRLAWLYVHGAWPADQIDHINGDRGDNRLANLREATRSQNNANSARYRSNSSGFKGVSWHKAQKKWHARIRVDWREIFLGSFTTAEEAHAAYCRAAAEHFGKFARAA